MILTRRPLSRSNWKRCYNLCQETESEINPSNAQVLWGTLNNKVGQTMPAVSFKGEVIERTNSLRYLLIHFDRMLTYKTDVVESTKLRWKKRLSTQKDMIALGIEQRHLFLLYQNEILSVIDYDLGLINLLQSNLLRLDRVQHEALRVVLGKAEDTPIQAMCYLLDLPPMETIQGGSSQSVSQCGAESPRIHFTVLSEKKRGVEWPAR